MLGFLFEPLLVFEPIVAVTIFAIIILLIINIFQRLLVNQQDAKQIKERSKEMNKQMREEQKAGNTEKVNEMMKDIMVENNKGKVINMSSVRGIRATLWAGNEGYAATKGAVDMITRTVASEWAQYNINVNAIGPSLIRTELAGATLNNPEKLARYMDNVPMKKVGEPEDIMGLCVFLASPASDFITGQIIYLDGGLTAIG